MNSYPIGKTPYPVIFLVPVGVQVFVYPEIWQFNFPATNLVILRVKSEMSGIVADVWSHQISDTRSTNDVYAKSKFADHSTKIGK